MPFHQHPQSTPARRRILNSSQTFDDLQTFHDIYRATQGTPHERLSRLALPAPAQGDDGAHAHVGERMVQCSQQLVPEFPVTRPCKIMAANRAGPGFGANEREASRTITRALRCDNGTRIAAVCEMRSHRTTVTAQCA